MAFPIQRLRRLRQLESFRQMVRETALSPADFIYPLFVVEGRDRREEIGSMPGQYRLSVDLLVKEAAEIKSLGIPAVILFGIPAKKDERGSSGYDPNGIVQRAIGIPVNLFTGIFALARTVGWIAQLNEMIGDPEYKIGRPRQLFSGAPHRNAEPLAKRN